MDEWPSSSLKSAVAAVLGGGERWAVEEGEIVEPKNIPSDPTLFLDLDCGFVWIDTSLSRVLVMKGCVRTSKTVRGVNIVCCTSRSMVGG